MFKSIYRQLLTALLLMGLLNIALLGALSYHQGKNALAKASETSTAYLKDYLKMAVESYTLEAQNTSDHLVRLLEGTIDINRLDDRDYLLNYIESIAPEVRRLAQNHEQSYTAYVYLNPRLVQRGIDVYYADQGGNGVAVRQAMLPITYFTDGPTELDDKSWWFGPQNFEGHYWTKPYEWTFDNGNKTGFVSVTRAVYMNGRFIGVVGTDIAYERLLDALKAVHGRTGGYAFLLTQGLEPLYYEPAQDFSQFVLRFRQLNDYETNGYLLSDLGAGTGTGVEAGEGSGGDWLIHSVQLHNKWYLGLRIDPNTTGYNLGQFSATLLMVLGIAMLQAITLAAISSHYLSRPLHDIARALAQQSNFYEPLQLNLGLIKRQDEIGKVARALIEMGKAIESSLRTIEVQRYNLKFQKQRDELTHLPNQDYLLGHGQELLNRMDNKPHAVVSLNIDNFRLLNGLLGTDTCNLILVEIATRLNTLGQEAKLIARTSGDEFTLIYPLKAPLDHLLFNLQGLLSGTYQFDHDDIHLSVSMGVALFPQHGKEMDVLIKNANIALNHAKQDHKGGYFVYDPGVSEISSDQFDMLKQLRQAIAASDMLVYYQPQYDCDTRQIVGAEALIRWKVGDHFVPPLTFIPLAEESRLIIPLGDMIMRKVFQFSKRLAEIGMPLKLSINISATQITWKHLYHQLMALCDRYDVKPTSIVLEITETLLASGRGRGEAQDVLSALHDKGFVIAIDDFGTGYSSLSYLKSIPFSILKLDRAFIKDYPDLDDGSIAKMIIELAHSLGATAIAEGMETEEQMTFLAECGCTFMQGYYFSKPVSEEDLIAQIRLYGDGSHGSGLPGHRHRHSPHPHSHSRP